MDRSDDFKRGWRNASRWAAEFLHREARSMNDPHARALLDCAASFLGIEAKRKLGIPLGEGLPIEPHFSDRQK